MKTKSNKKLPPACYEILGSHSQFQLHDLVNEAISQGKIPLGGVAVASLGQGMLNFYQAVCEPSAFINPVTLKNLQAALAACNARP